MWTYWLSEPELHIYRCCVSMFKASPTKTQIPPTKIRWTSLNTRISFMLVHLYRVINIQSCAAQFIKTCFMDATFLGKFSSSRVLMFMRNHPHLLWTWIPRPGQSWRRYGISLVFSYFCNYHRNEMLQCMDLKLISHYEPYIRQLLLSYLALTTLAEHPAYQRSRCEDRFYWRLQCCWSERMEMALSFVSVPKLCIHYSQ